MAINYTLTLADLLTSVTRQQLDSKILAILQKNQFPISDWQPGGVEKTLIELFTTALVDISQNAIPTITSGGFLTLAKGQWLTLYAEQMYALNRLVATHTLGNIQLDCSTGNGPYTINSGELFFQGLSGNIYINTTGGTLRAPGFSGVTHVGGGAGTVTPGGTNNTGKSCVVKIIGSGGVGVGTFQFSSDGGVTYTSTAVIPALYTDTDTGITVTFAGAFIATDTYSFDSYGRLVIQVQSEFPNDSTATPALNYTDASNTITKMITTLVGVTASNSAPDFSTVTLIGTSTGLVKPKRTVPGTPPTPAAIVVRIDTQGQAGVATWSYSIDGGAFISAGASTSFNVGGGTTVQIFNGIANPSFIAGDTFSFTTPGTWITSQGVDEESDESLVIRCQARWPGLADVPTADVYDSWARSATAQVTKTFVTTSPTINDKVLIYVAGPGGILPSGVINTVQLYIDARAPITDLPQVLSPTPRTVTLSGATIYVSAELLTTAQGLAQAAVSKYINTTLNMNGRVVLAQIIEEVMAIEGISNLIGLSITGANSGPDLQLPVTPSASELAQWSQDLISLWAWIPTT